MGGLNPLYRGLLPRILNRKVESSLGSWELVPIEGMIWEDPSCTDPPWEAPLWEAPNSWLNIRLAFFLGGEALDKEACEEAPNKVTAWVPRKPSEMFCVASNNCEDCVAKTWLDLNKKEFCEPPNVSWERELENIGLLIEDTILVPLKSRASKVALNNESWTRRESCLEW